MGRLLKRLGILTLVVLAGSALGAEPGDEETMAACTEHLKAIGKAIQAYQADHHQLPDQLSDLYPKYVPDEAIFHCPADPTKGSTGRDFLHRDPKMPMSYSYQLSADESNGLPMPLGTFPKPDIGTSWGTLRLVGLREMDFYGDQVPVVRCFHHKADYTEIPKVLSLTMSGRVYRSLSQWEDHPDSVQNVLKTATAEIQTDPEHFAKTWYLGRLEEYLTGKGSEEQYRAQRPAIKAFAEALGAGCEKMPQEQRWFASRLSAELYHNVDENQRALEMARKAIRLGVEQGMFTPAKVDRKDIVDPVQRMSQLLAGIQRGLGHPEDQLMIELLSHRCEPENGYYVRKTAELQEAMNGGEAAERWKDLADPTRTLLNKSAPDFAVEGVDGQPIALKDVLAGHKAVLIDFWFYGCGACREESPHLTKVYAELKDRGLGALAVDNGDTPQRVNEFIQQFDLRLPVGISKAARDHSDIFSRYGVRVYPTTFLIDADGKVVWRAVGFDEQNISELRKKLAEMGIQ